MQISVPSLTVTLEDPKIRPVVVMPWNTEFPGWTAAKVQLQLQEKTQLLQVNFLDPNISNEELVKEKNVLLKQVCKEIHAEKSILRQTIELVKQTPHKYPNLAKINEMAKSLVSDADGIVLPGGDDIPAELYGHEQHAKTKPNQDIRRDWLDICLIIQIFEQNRPCLALCRSAQMVNVVGTDKGGGGTLKQHVEGHQWAFPYYHKAKEAPDSSFIAQIMKRRQSSSIRVFEFNHQFVDTLAAGFQKILEVHDLIYGPLTTAFECRNVVCIQSHPEFRMHSHDNDVNFYKTMSPENSDIYEEFIKRMEIHIQG